MVCGPEGEVCACYHNGYELLSGEETTAYDGDFFACWLEAEPQMSTSVATGGNSVSSTSGWVPTVEYNSSSPTAAGVDNRQWPSKTEVRLSWVVVTPYRIAA